MNLSLRLVLKDSAHTLRPVTQASVRNFRSVSFVKRRRTKPDHLRMSLDKQENFQARSGHKKIRLRGHPSDQEEVRLSKTLSWVLRHGARTAGLYMRKDGYVRVNELLALDKFRSMDFQTLEGIVQHDAKSRYHLLFEPGSVGGEENVWWIRANQGHTLKEVDVEMSEVTDAGQVPMAVHGTSIKAWEKIQTQGLSPMKRAHIHLAQYDSHVKGLSTTAGLRSFSQILIYVDLDKALRAGIKFFLSSNGVILTKGDDTGFLPPEFFKVVTDIDGKPLHDWNNLLGSSESQKSSRSREASRQRPKHLDGSKETVPLTVAATDTTVMTDTVTDGSPNNTSPSQSTGHVEVSL